MGGGCSSAARKKGDIQISSCSWAKKDTGSVSLLGDAGPPTRRVTGRDVKGRNRVLGSAGSGTEGGGPASLVASFPCPILLLIDQVSVRSFEAACVDGMTEVRQDARQGGWSMVLLTRDDL